MYEMQYNGDDVIWSDIFVVITNLADILLKKYPIANSDAIY